MKSGYISDFTLFMNHYLAIHPEVVEDQKRGWDKYWNRKVDLTALKKAREDYVPDDGYGFHPADWGVTHRPTVKEPTPGGNMSQASVAARIPSQPGSLPKKR